MTSSGHSDPDPQTSLDKLSFQNQNSHVSLQSTSLSNPSSHNEGIPSIEFSEQTTHEEQTLDGLTADNINFETGAEYQEMVHDMVHPSERIWERRQLDEMVTDKRQRSQILIEQKMCWGNMLEPISEEQTCDLENSVAMQSFNLSFMDMKDDKPKQFLAGGLTSPFGHRSNLSDLGLNHSASKWIP